MEPEWVCDKWVLFWNSTYSETSTNKKSMTLTNLMRKNILFWPTANKNIDRGKETRDRKEIVGETCVRCEEE